MYFKVLCKSTTSEGCSVVLSAARGEEEPVSGPGAAPEPAPRHGAVVCGAMCHCSVPSVDCVVSRS